jgi:hypothetical protein
MKSDTELKRIVLDPAWEKGNKAKLDKLVGNLAKEEMVRLNQLFKEKCVLDNRRLRLMERLQRHA